MVDRVDLMIYARLIGRRLAFQPYSFAVGIKCWIREMLNIEARRLGYVKGKRGRPNFSTFILELVRRYVANMDCMMIQKLDYMVTGSCGMGLSISRYEDHELIESIIDRCTMQNVYVNRAMIIRAAVAAYSLEKGWLREETSSTTINTDDEIELCQGDRCEVV